MFVSLIIAVLIPGIALEDQPALEPPPIIVGQWGVLFPALPFEVPEPEPEPEIQAASPPPSPPPASSPPAPPPAPPSGDGRYGVGEPWASLAECESGNWIDGGASFERGSARWHWAKPGTAVPPWGTTIHHGGLQFHPGTWDAYRIDGYPARAYDATPQQQVAVAERVLAAQGWGAWPTCARKLGLR